VNIASTHLYPHVHGWKGIMKSLPLIGLTVMRKFSPTDALFSLNEVKKNVTRLLAKFIRLKQSVN
jgi:hypothetical protein